MRVSENFKTNPIGLNVIIGLLLLSAAWSLLSAAKGPIQFFSLALGLIPLVLGYGLLKRSEWARKCASILSAFYFLISLPSLFLLFGPVGFRRPLVFIQLFSTSATLFTCIYLWKQNVRSLFSGQPAPPVTAKSFFFFTAAPAVLLVLGLGVGAFFLIKSSFSDKTGKFGALTPETAQFTVDVRVSNDLIDGDIDGDDIAKLIFVKFPKEYWSSAEWGPHYPGFPKATLTGDETRQLLQNMSTARKFTYVIKETRKQEGNRTIIGGEKKPEATEQENQFQRFQNRATKRYDNGEFQVYLKNGRFGTLVVYWDEQEVGFMRASNPWLIGYSSDIAQMIERLMPRLAPDKTDVLFPELTSEQANKKAHEKHGEMYQQSLDYLRKSQKLTALLGTLRDIRPAMGQNWANWWLEDTTRFTFKVVGDKGEAVAAVSGLKLPTWKLSGQLIFNGVQHEI